MADKIEFEETLTRAEFAEYLQDLADAFDDDGPATVRIGNKEVTLNPPERVKSEIEVVERSSILRGQREAIGLDATWKAVTSEEAE